MAGEGKGRIFRQGEARTMFVSIPSKVATDSSFPFEEGERVKVKIEGGKIAILKFKKI
jgi:hypothetical protein